MTTSTTSAKFNKSEIFKAAWALVKTAGKSLSEALKAAWAKAKAPKEIKFNGTVYGKHVYINNVKTLAADVLPELKAWFLMKTLWFAQDGLKVDVKSTEAYAKYAAWIEANGTLEYMFSNPNTPSFDGCRIASLVKQSM